MRSFPGLAACWQCRHNGCRSGAFRPAVWPRRSVHRIGAATGAGGASAEVFRPDVAAISNTGPRAQNVWTLADMVPIAPDIAISASGCARASPRRYDVSARRPRREAPIAAGEQMVQAAEFRRAGRAAERRSADPTGGAEPAGGDDPYVRLMFVAATRRTQRSRALTAERARIEADRFHGGTASPCAERSRADPACSRRVQDSLCSACGPATSAVAPLHKAQRILGEQE